jgi:hypothetical protein
MFARVVNSITRVLARLFIKVHTILERQDWFWSWLTRDAAENSGDTGGRFWFGYIFSGGPTNESFYERADGVTDSAAWNVVESDDGQERNL